MKVSLSKIEKHLEKPDNMKQFFESAIKTADLGSVIPTVFMDTNCRKLKVSIKLSVLH